MGRASRTDDVDSEKQRAAGDCFYRIIARAHEGYFEIVTGFRNGIIARSLAPTTSIFWPRSWLRNLFMVLRPYLLFSSMKRLANLPLLMSFKMRFISACVFLVTTRGPET